MEQELVLGCSVLPWPHQGIVQGKGAGGWKLCGRSSLYLPLQVVPSVREDGIVSPCGGEMFSSADSLGSAVPRQTARPGG